MATRVFTEGLKLPSCSHINREHLAELAGLDDRDLAFLLSLLQTGEVDDYHRGFIDGCVAALRARRGPHE